jgi:hypothetical protein
MVERYEPEKATDTKAARDKAARDRSPSFPFVPLQEAIERLVQFEDYFKRHPAPTAKVGLAWKMKENSSQSLQMMAALKAFGLLDSKRGSGEISVSEDGRTYLRAQQETVRQEVVKRAAIKPTLISKYWEHWGADRPPNPVCLDELVLKGGFTKASAETFLNVYDSTIKFAKLSRSDKVAATPEEIEDNEIDDQAPPMMPHVQPPPKPATPPPAKPGMMQEIFALDEGPVTLTFPASLSSESYQDLADHIGIFLRKASRRAGAYYVESYLPQGVQADKHWTVNDGIAAVTLVKNIIAEGKIARIRCPIDADPKIIQEISDLGVHRF